MRTCVGCRRVADQRELVRLASTPDGVAVGRSLPGRGAWLCPGTGCLDPAIGRGGLARALRIDRSAVDAAALRQRLEADAPVS